MSIFGATLTFSLVTIYYWENLGQDLLVIINVQACFDNVHDLCSWIINNQWIFLGRITSLILGKRPTHRYCLEYVSQNSSCTRYYREVKRVNSRKCYCNEDLCNTGNWDRDLSYLLMGITIGFQIVINCLVVWKYRAKLDPKLYYV